MVAHRIVLSTEVSTFKDCSSQLFKDDSDDELYINIDSCNDYGLLPLQRNTAKRLTDSRSCYKALNKTVKFDMANPISLKGFNM